MGQVIKIRGEAARANGTASPMRQPGEAPASQFVSIGTAVSNLLEKLESRMNERAITVP